MTKTEKKKVAQAALGKLLAAASRSLRLPWESSWAQGKPVKPVFSSELARIPKVFQLEKLFTLNSDWQGKEFQNRRMAPRSVFKS